MPFRKRPYSSNGSNKSRRVKSRPKSARRYGKKRRYNKTKRFRSLQPFTPSKLRAIKQLIDKETHNDVTTTWRELRTGFLQSNTNEHAYQSFSFLNRGSINKALALDRETTTNITSVGQETLDGAPSAVENITRGLHTVINYARLVFKMRNNCNVPVKISCWKLHNKRRFQSTHGPIQSIQEGLVASGLGSTAITDIRYSASDSAAFKLHFKVMSQMNFTLLPGKEKTITLTRSTPFKYSHDEFLSHGASWFDPKFTQWLLFKTTGVIGHSSDLSENVGRMPTQIDYEEMESITFERVTSSFAHSHQSGNYLPALPAPPIATAIDTNTNELNCSKQDTEGGAVLQELVQIEQKLP